MRRRDCFKLVGAAAALLVARPWEAVAQTGRSYRVGLLETVSETLNGPNLNALRTGLRRLGYVEGQNLVLIYRSADGGAERFPALAAELLHLGVDLIVTRGTPAAQAAKNATAKVPIVMAAIGEPLGVGVVASLARPGGNITGLSAFAVELTGKRVQFLKDMLPSVGRIAFMQNMGNPVSEQEREASQSAAAALGLAIELDDVRTAADIAIAFETMAGRKTRALVVGLDGLLQENRGMIAELANHHRIAAIYPSREFVEAGGLASHGVSYPDLYYRAAGLIDKIFKGAAPGDLPVEQPIKLETVINLRTAKAIGIDLPPTLVAVADEVIE
jgi:putative tryptophan/tyrosine transport system substrate-binding protein